MKLTAATALIQVLNVALATKAVIAGATSAPLLATAYLVMVLIAVASLWRCTRVFDRRSSLFPGA